MYSSNILNKKKPKVIQHIFTSNFVFDLSCVDTFKLKKSFIRTAFQTNFCRGVTPFFSKTSSVKKAKFQTAQLALHCSRSSIKPLERRLLSDGVSKIPANVPSRFFNFKTKTNIAPFFLGKNGRYDLLPFDLKLNSPSLLYKQGNQSQNTRNFSGSIFKKKSAFFLKKPKVFIKVISEVFNKAINKGYLCKKVSGESEGSLIAAFKKPKKAFFNLGASLSSLVFNMKNRISVKSKTVGPSVLRDQKGKDKRHTKNQAYEGRWITTLEGSSSLAGQKGWSSQISTAYPDALKSEDFSEGSLVRAGWILGRLIGQLSKKKIYARAAMNQQINNIRILMDKMGSECPIKGMRITITGRLGSRKKAMAQQISKCVGKVPLSTFRQNVDYRQGVLPTKFGLVGVKIWVCYANNAP